MTKMPPTKRDGWLEAERVITSTMYEIRVYRMVGTNKIRTLKIKKTGNWFGIWGWLRLWFTIRKADRTRAESQRDITRDCAPAQRF
jgi:hypothetical protein